MSDAADTILSKVTEQDGGIYTATLKSSAAKEVAIELQITGKPVARIPSPRVTLKPQLIFTKVRVNGAEFDVDKGFPQTEFEGARFQLLVNGTEANNKDYDWSSSDQNVVVDASGLVTIENPLDPNSLTISITAKNKDIQNNAQSYKFTLEEWWINSGLQKLTNSESITFCSTAGSEFALPLISFITNATEQQKTNATRVAKRQLWSEWGSMTHYYGYGWQSDNYWTRDPNGYSVQLGNGHVVDTPGNTSTSYVACVKYY